MLAYFVFLVGPMGFILAPLVVSVRRTIRYNRSIGYRF